jgi:hypothetical protein
MCKPNTLETALPIYRSCFMVWGTDIPGSTGRLKELAKGLGPNILQGRPFMGLGRDVW